MKYQDLVIGEVYAMKIYPNEKPRPVKYRGRNVANADLLDFIELATNLSLTRKTCHSIVGVWDGDVPVNTMPTAKEIISTAMEKAGYIVQTEQLQSLQILLVSLGVQSGLCEVDNFVPPASLVREPAIYIKHSDASALLKVLNDIQFKPFDDLEQRNINDHLK